MKKCLTLLFCTTVLVAFAADSKAEKEVNDAMEAWKKATMSKDLTALEKLLHPDLSYSHSNAKHESRADVLKAVSGNTKAEAINFKNNTVRVFGKTALVKGDVDIRNSVDGKVTENHLNILHVWVKSRKAGNWSHGKPPGYLNAHR
ncbi:MAG: nuclear transport factor 2 family protein [Bryobacteraceae bacterium]